MHALTHRHTHTRSRTHTHTLTHVTVLSQVHRDWSQLVRLSTAMAIFRLSLTDYISRTSSSNRNTSAVWKIVIHNKPDHCTILTCLICCQDWTTSVKNAESWLKMPNTLYLKLIRKNYIMYRQTHLYLVVERLHEAWCWASVVLRVFLKVCAALGAENVRAID